MRSFEIIRKPDAEPSFLCNNVEVRYVGTCPETGISFYSSTRCTYGVKVFPDGRKAVENTCTCNTPNSKVLYNARRKQHYLYFRHAFGQKKGILAAHAVWMAAGRTVPEGMTIDHINGCTTDNCIENLRCITSALNVRDGGFLRKLRHKGINPVAIQRSYLLRYFDRMAVIKTALTEWKYEHLSYNDLQTVLYDSPESLSTYFATFFNLQIYFKL